MTQVTGTPVDQINRPTIDALKAALNTTPNIKRYKAVITAFNEGNIGMSVLHARVLNGNDSDYLGDLTWEYRDIGTFYLSGYPFTTEIDLVNGPIENENFAYCKINHFLNQYGVEHIAEIKMNIDHVELSITQGGQITNVIGITPFLIELIVIERGVSPILLSAVIPIEGDKLTLTFDKPISPFGIQHAIRFSVFSMGWSGEFSSFAINGNCLDLIFYPQFFANVDFEVEIPILNYRPYNSPDPRFYVESRDFGKLEPFEEFPIILNMPT